jgi:hypothetical protein
MAARPARRRAWNALPELRLGLLGLIGDVSFVANIAIGGLRMTKLQRE